jgi:hypothetical protein
MLTLQPTQGIGDMYVTDDIASRDSTLDIRSWYGDNGHRLTIREDTTRRLTNEPCTVCDNPSHTFGTCSIL